MNLKLPNILITGTPGSGKTTLCSLLQSCCPELEHIEIGKIVKERSLHYGYDLSHQSFIINEDLVVDELEERIQKGGVLVDHHSSSFFPERWFDLIVCLVCDNTVLYDRLLARNYPKSKIEENVECEIMHVVLDEAQESYENVLILESNCLEDIEQNVRTLDAWFESREG